MARENGTELERLKTVSAGGVWKHPVSALLTARSVPGSEIEAV